MHTNFGINFDGYPGTTVTFTAVANVAYDLADTGVTLIDGEGHAAIMVLITVEAYGVRCAWGTDATATLGHLRADGDSLQLSGKAAADGLSMRNAVNGENFIVQVTPFFAKYDNS